MILGVFHKRFRHFGGGRGQKSLKFANGYKKMGEVVVKNREKLLTSFMNGSLGHLIIHASLHMVNTEISQNNDPNSFNLSLES